MHRILLVEDNPVNRQLIHRRLSSRDDFLIAEAHDGETAVQIAYHYPPDLILMDMSLPIMDGWEATALLRQYEVTKHIPIIALTAHVMERDRRRAFEVGCNGFIAKPIDFRELTRVVNQALGCEPSASSLNVLPPAN